MDENFKNLEYLGWNEKFQNEFQEYNLPESIPARVFRSERENYWVFAIEDEFQAKVSGRFRHHAKDKSAYPVVGDWVAINVVKDNSLAIIHKVLERNSKFSRKTAGKTSEEHVLASNIEICFIVCGLDNDFNLRRIERYLTLVWESGSKPVILLNKVDLCEEKSLYIEQVEDIAFGVPIHTLSATKKMGLDVFSTYLQEGKTSVLLGSSGVGKSSIINALMGEDLVKTSSVRQDDSRGIHTTTNRQMFKLYSGAFIIDTPGLRELQMYVDEEEALKNVFSDIEKIAQQCRFDNCKHDSEPGCAVKDALESGEINGKRFQSYLKLQREIAFNMSKQDKKLNMLEQKKWKNISKLCKEIKKMR